MNSFQNNKKSNYRLTVIIALLLTLLSCKSTDLGVIDLNILTDTAGKIANLGDKTDQQETEFGFSVAQTLLTDSRILHNETIQEYVNSVGQWLVQNSERPELSWHFIVLDDRSFNAFAAPGGYIFITAGTLLRLNSEAELAGVLSHEIAHVLKRHYLNALQKETKLDLFSDLSIAAYQYNQNRNDQSDSEGNVVLAKQLSGAIESIYSNGLAKEDELQADLMAVVINARAGYDPFAYIAVLQNIASENPDTSAWASFTQRHPPASDRLAALSFVMDEPFFNLTSYKVLMQRYQASIR